MDVLERPDVECSCKECQNMCTHAPCWGTPEQAKLLIEEGYSDKLQCAVYYQWPDDIYVLCPRVKGDLGERNPKIIATYTSGWAGECIFFTEDRLCALHDKKVDGQRLKPLEGRLVDHNRNYDPHDDIAELWDNPEAQNLVQQWLNNEI